MVDPQPKNDICSRLVELYIRDDQTPDHLVSSHWKELHQEMEVTESNGNIQKMKGEGFGYVDQMSFPAQCFSWASIVLNFLVLSHKGELLRLTRVARKVCRRMGIFFSYDCFRQMCSFRLIREYSSPEEKFTCMIIGDGYGFLSCLIKELYPQCQLVLVDLGKTLLFQAKNGQQAYPKARHYLVGSENTCDMGEADFVYCPAENTEHLKGKIRTRWMVNIASMQEMNAETVTGYFALIREIAEPDNVFYCCNRYEKIMPGGEVSRFYEFPWLPEDDHRVEGKCPWHQFFVSMAKTKRGPTLLGIRLPFIKYFDGTHYHRLSRMATHS